MEQLGLSVWYDDQTTLSIIYWAVAIPATAIFMYQLFISFSGSWSEKAILKAKHNPSSGEEVEISFQLINYKNIIGFFAVFGWSGLACLDAGLSNSSTIATSLVCGIIMMVIMAVILYYMSKLMKTVDEDL